MSVPAKTILGLLIEEDLCKVIDSNNSLKSMVLGYVVEETFCQQALGWPEIKSVVKIPDRNKQKGDFLLVTTSGVEFTVEVKVMSFARSSEDLLEGGVKGSVCLKLSDTAVVEGGKTSALPRGAYDVLAISLLASTGQNKFLFLHSKYLPSSTLYPDRIVTSMDINTSNTPCVRDNIAAVIRDLD